jgi:hypothetical protein
LDTEDVEKAVEEQRSWLRGQLDVAAEKLNVEPTGEVVNTYDVRSAGTRAWNGETEVWLRVVFENPMYQPACRWEGNVEANAIHGLPKPTVLRWEDWKNTEPLWHGCRVRGEVSTLASGTTISPDAPLRHDPRLPDSWWAVLRTALHVLAAHPVPDDDPVDTIGFTIRGAKKHFDVEFDEYSFKDVVWSTAHADLHWGNLTGPELCILDWESWRRAPAGYDAATLYCTSLFHPSTARRVRDVFGDLLDTRSGQVATLSAVVRYLAIVGEGAGFNDIEDQLRTIGQKAINSL